MAPKKVIRHSQPLSRDQWMERLERVEFLSAEHKRRKISLEPMFYGCPDLMFPKGYDQGTFDMSTRTVVRERLEQEETDEDYAERQNQALYDLVTQFLAIVKDDKLIKIQLIPKMAEILGDLFFGRVDKLILWANRGGGKCQAHGTPIIMADGRVEVVENIKTGDRLMGPDGRACTVLSTTRGRGPMYRVTPTKGEPWVCNDKHVLTLVKHGHRNGGGEIIDIAVEDYLAKNKTFRESYKQFSVGINEFEPSDYKPLDIDPYFLGVWFGDGTKFTKTLADGSRALARVQVTKPDPEIRALCEAVAASWGLRVHEKRSTSDCPTFSIVNDRGRGNPLLGEMRATVGSEIKIPDAILRGTREVRLQFLAGFLDTDAELHHNGFVIAQKREDWARTVWWIARSLGLMATIKEITKSCQNDFTGVYHQVSIYGDTDLIPTRIPRKQAEPRKQRKDATRTGITIEPIGEGDYYGFLLDGDGRFLLGDFTVTHNSLLAAVYMWISFVYKRKSCLNMGGAGNQARRVYDYTKQFWHNFPGMLEGMLERDPLLQSTELKNGSKLICSTSVTTAIGEHIGIFVADEASLLPWCQLLTSDGVREISGIRPGQRVIGKDGNYQKVLEQFSHPYDGRILWLRPYGSAFPCWITEEHRVWAIADVPAPKKRKKVCPGPYETEGLAPAWVRAWDLKRGDILCYPRFHKVPGPEFELELKDRILTGPDLWRFFGYWAGDGGAPTGTRGAYPIKLHLSEAKSWFFKDAERLLRKVSTGSVRYSQPPSRGKAVDLVAASDKILHECLRKYVGIGFERGFPQEWFEQATDEELKNYLIGHIRTDGTRNLRKDGILSRWSVTTTAEGLAINLLYALNRLGVPHTLCYRESFRYGKKNRDRWDIHFSPTAIQTLLPMIDFVGVSFPNAQAPIASKTWYDEDWCYAVIKEIEEDWYTGEVYDLKMDGDPSFGTPACTMLHNCTDRPGADHDLMRAMQGAMSEVPHTIFLLSTFHLPIGFFADVWDSAEDLGFLRVMWNCFETMLKCEAGLEFATEEDPQAIEAFCKPECPLSWQIDTHDEFGNVTGQKWVGCLGTARESEGWQTREVVLDEQKINQGTRIFPVEHACFVPETLVMTASGFVPIEEIRVDTLVLTHTGQWKPVTDVMCRHYEGEIIYGEGQGRLGFGVTPEHPIFQKTKTDQITERWYPAARLKKTNRNGCSYYKGYYPPADPNTFSPSIEIPVPLGGCQEPMIWEIPTSDEFFEWLGIHCGDGWFDFSNDHARIGVAARKDAGSVGDRWQELEGRLFDRRVYRHNDDQRSISFAGFARWLSREGGRYSYEKHIPRQLFPGMRSSNIRAFLRGYTLADGCIQEGRCRSVRWGTTSRRLAGQIYTMLIREDFAAGISHTPPSKSVFHGKEYDAREAWVVSSYGPYADALCIWLGDGVKPHVEGKNSHIRIRADGYQESRISKVRVEQYLGKVFNLSVAGDESYCLPGLAVHNCIRPEREGNIYNRTLIDACLVPFFSLCLDRPKIVGIDWGLTQCAIVLVGEWSEPNPENSEYPIEGVGVIDIVYMSNRLTDAVVDQIKRWQLRYGDEVVIRADGSHPYCNREVATHGYRVIPVHGDRKLLGEDNLARWLGSGHLKILDGFELFVTQLHNLRRNVLTGKQIKRNLEGDEGDHGPDALKFAMMAFDYVRWTRQRQQEYENLKEKQERPVQKGKMRRTGFDSLLH